MAVDIEIFTTFSVLPDLTENELQQLAAASDSLSVIAGEILASQGAPARNLFINLTGNFMISHNDLRAITVHTSGDLLGISSLIAPFRYKRTTTALTDGKVLAVSSQHLRGASEEASALADKLMPIIQSTMAQRDAVFDGS
jgi:CRP-like cAMP-binding protein